MKMKYNINCVLSSVAIGNSNSKQLQAAAAIRLTATPHMKCKNIILTIISDKQFYVLSGWYVSQATN